MLKKIEYGAAMKKSFPLSNVYQLIEPGPVVMVSSAYKNKTNIMTMAWHMMMEFTPALIGCIISDQNYSFNLIKKSKQCIINIPTVELAPIVVCVGSTTGAKVDKFQKFNLTPIAGQKIDAPLIEECYANIECKVVDTRLVAKYNLFIVQAVKAWITPSKQRPLTIHHAGNGIFIVDGKIIKLPFKSKK